MSRDRVLWTTALLSDGVFSTLLGGECASTLGVENKSVAGIGRRGVSTRQSLVSRRVVPTGPFGRSVSKNSTHSTLPLRSCHDPAVLPGSVVAVTRTGLDASHPAPQTSKMRLGRLQRLGARLGGSSCLGSDGGD